MSERARRRPTLRMQDLVRLRLSGHDYNGIAIEMFLPDPDSAHWDEVLREEDDTDA